MALRYLLDTNICFYAGSSGYPLVTRKLDRQSMGKVCISLLPVSIPVAGRFK